MIVKFDNELSPKIAIFQMQLHVVSPAMSIKLTKRVDTSSSYNIMV